MLFQNILVVGRVPMSLGTLTMNFRELVPLFLTDGVKLLLSTIGTPLSIPGHSTMFYQGVPRYQLVDRPWLHHHNIHLLVAISTILAKQQMWDVAEVKLNSLTLGQSTPHWDTRWWNFTLILRGFSFIGNFPTTIASDIGGCRQDPLRLRNPLSIIERSTAFYQGALNYQLAY